MPIDNDGSAILPTFTFLSERSLGLYRATTGTIGVSGNIRQQVGTGKVERGASIEFWKDGTPSIAAAVGLLQMAAGAALGNDLVFNIFNGTSWQTVGRFSSVASQFQVVAGSAIGPSYGFMSEASLGFYRSASSTMALSYGTLAINANLNLSTAGNKVLLKNGTNASFGTATLGSNGSVNVATTIVTANSVVFLTDQTASGTLGQLSIGGLRAGSGFTILSSNVLDTSTVAWWLVEPAP